jgi:hypothetical protein
VKNAGRKSFELFPIVIEECDTGTHEHFLFLLQFAETHDRIAVLSATPVSVAGSEEGTFRDLPAFFDRENFSRRGRLRVGTKTPSASRTLRPWTSLVTKVGMETVFDIEFSSCAAPRPEWGFLRLLSGKKEVGPASRMQNRNLGLPARSLPVRPRTCWRGHREAPRNGAMHSQSKSMTPGFRDLAWCFFEPLLPEGV